MGSKNSPAGNTTTTTNAAPWAPQQPYLSDIFGQAQSLYNTGGPAYYPGSTYAPPTSEEAQALGTLESSGLGGSPINQQAQDTNTALMSGYANSNNPAFAGLEGLANQNLGQTGVAPSGLQSIGGSNLGLTNPSAPWLQSLGTQNLGFSGPASAGLEQLGGSNLGLTAPGAGALEGYAGGNYLNGGAANPYTQALSQSVLSSVVPSIESQFVQGGGLSSPQAAFATASGATNALAPSLFSNYQTQEQLQQNAASTLGNQAIAGGTLQANALGTLGNQVLSGEANQTNALGTLGNQALSGQANQTNALGTLGNQTIAGQANQANDLSSLGSLFNTGTQNQLGALALEPQTQQVPYQNVETALGAAQTEQGVQQSELNSAIQNYNYNQTLPWQNLNQYIAQVTGNYGGTTSATQPYYENTGANIGAGALGGGLLGNSLFSSGGLLGGGAVSQGAGKGLGSLLGAGLALSDIRIKRDVQKLAELPSGLGVYSFRFAGDDEYHIGLMAQEVEQVLPEAVVTKPSGLKMVDYSAFA